MDPISSCPETPKVATGPESVPSLPGAGTTSAPDMRALEKKGKAAARKLRAFVRKHREQLVDGKYLCVESLQYLGALLGCTALISKTEEFEDIGQVQGFVAVAHIRNAGGQIVASAEAVCMRNEPDWSEKPAFQLRSMASTRAIAKAFRNLFAWVVVLAGYAPTPAEEMQFRPTETAHHSKMSGKKCYQCGNQLSDALWRETRKKHGMALCVNCKKTKEASDAQAENQKFSNVVNDPKFVPESVAKVQEKKAVQGQPQPIVALMDRHKDAYSL